jgi:hypothetical protein
MTEATGIDALRALGANFGMVKATSEKGKETYIPFDRNVHLTFGEGDPTTPYTKRKKSEKLKATTFKYGQLKLFLAELQFFNLYYDPEIHKNPVCIYIGAALGTHIATLAQMYSMIKFKLYDPAKFNREVLDPVPNIEIFEQFFTNEDANEWAQEQKLNKVNIFLLVDIRNRGYKKIDDPDKNQNDFRKNEKLVADDMDLQRSWFKIIKPTKALLKMRLPYYEKFLTTPETRYEYLDGIVYRQQFASQTSTETRFVPYDANDNGEYPTRIWNIITYESITNSHNKELREGIIIKENIKSGAPIKEYVQFINPFSNTDKKIKITDPIAEKIGLMNDYDSTAATYIILDYLIKFRVNPTYDQFYQLAKTIFIDVGKSNIWDFNLRGVREKERFVNENGEILEQEPKLKRGTEDPENIEDALE